MVDVKRIVAPNPGPMTLEGTNTYVVGSDPCYVIDPGPDDAGHLAAVLAEAEQRGGAAGVLLTHSHLDHSAGVASLGLELLEVAGAETVGPFRVIPTPGHCPDHVCFLIERTLFSGDLILGAGFTIVPPGGAGEQAASTDDFGPGSLTAYLDSLERVRELDLEIIHPGHGPDITNPTVKIDEYIEHRLDRERKLVAALGDGVRTEDELLDRAWDDVPDVLRPAAALVLRAHLEKLREEGRLPSDLPAELGGG